jgi:hypothetical protein
VSAAVLTCACVRQGGAFKLVSGSSPRLVNVTIARNDAFFAGGIYAEARLLLAYLLARCSSLHVSALR